MRSHYALLAGIAVVAASAAAWRLTADRNLFLQICRWVVVLVMLFAGMLTGVFGTGSWTQSGPEAGKERENRYQDAKNLLLAGIPSLLAVLFLRFLS
ncbi:MAG: DUF5316 domain-containing protein [Firmicutes bacterium]|nr:DUF5316 domain-containing protein [Bacillota bacterium]